MVCIIGLDVDDVFSCEFEVCPKTSEFKASTHIWYLTVDKGLVRVMIEEYPRSFP